MIGKAPGVIYEVTSSCNLEIYVLWKNFTQYFKTIFDAEEYYLELIGEYRQAIYSDQVRTIGRLANQPVVARVQIIKHDHNQQPGRQLFVIEFAEINSNESIIRYGKQLEESQCR